MVVVFMRDLPRKPTRHVERIAVAITAGLLSPSIQESLEQVQKNYSKDAQEWFPTGNG